METEKADKRKISTEDTPAKSTNENSSLHIYCRTNLVTKTYVYVWAIDEIWSMYEIISYLKFDPMDGRLPFEIHLECDRSEEKLIFYVEASSSIQKFLCHVYLQSYLSEEDTYILPHYYDVDKVKCEIKKSFLKNVRTEFVHRNILKVIFKFECIERILHNTRHIEMLNNHSDLKDLLPSESNALIEFKVGNKKYFVNKEILCAKSQYFKLILRNDNTSITLDEKSTSGMLTFIAFIESGDTSDIKTANIYMLFELIEMAQKYDIEGLQDICEEYLQKYLLLKTPALDTKKACDILIHALNYGSTDLLTFVTDLIRLNIDEYAESSYFRSIKRKYPRVNNLLKQITLTNEARKAHYLFDRHI
ncbi:hypothetical protein EAI_12254 [Harpegnathos saltator]|uniref:BTB domain-containing protein n=1 Tax=Harpegnathos saltator TaxID=610380 RepID=E2BC71_HARSA|nr:hypothetical protein EAI_12254 [Harpegnathos saltator]